MPGYVDRGIAGAISTVRGVPVIIVEGARAVGKTSTMKKQIVPQGYSYVTLADPGTLAFARADLPAWLRSLRHPVVIDEAQLLDELPLAVKEWVDGLGAGQHVILTGSASIGRTGLGGSDPLVRRAIRLTMAPLTGRELAGRLDSVVDSLFDGQVRPGVVETFDDRSLMAILRRGGFPAYAFADDSPALLDRRIRADVAGLLSDSALLSVGRDAVIATTLLDTLWRSPGAVLNASRLGGQLDVDRRTVERYVGLFIRLFLVFALPNLATYPPKQGHLARSKVHPCDVSLCLESLHRAGISVLDRREYWGQVLESYVVAQVTAATQWASLECASYYWRESGRTPREVDLVLRDERGRCVGIEVKASSTVHPRDLDRLKAFDRSHPLHRGYIVYRGREVRQLDERAYALPIEALADGSLAVADSS